MVDEPRDGCAFGMLRIAERRVLLKYPFHARLLARWEKHPSTETTTMAVTVRDGCVQLLFCSGTVINWTLDELAAVLVHEVNHVLFGHLFMDPIEFPDADALVTAQEISANEWVLDELPGRPILLEHFPYLPPNESTRDRYTKLATASTKRSPSPAGGNATRIREGDADHSEGSPTNRDSSNALDGEVSEDDGVVSPRGEAGDARSLGASGPSEPIDDHALWEEARACAPARTAVAATAIEARAAVSVEEWARIDDNVKDAIERTMQLALGQGRLPGGVLAGVGEGKSGVDWRNELRRLVGQARAREATFSWPSRRQPHLVGIVPGWRERPGRPRLMAVIDTSGSVTDELIADISAELNAMLSIAEITVVECDAVIHRTYLLEGTIKEVVGRGGTNLQPPFEPGFLRKHTPDAIVYFTDGDGPAPKRAPPKPVLWCLVPGGRRPSSWGRVVQMPGVPWWMKPGVRWGWGRGGGSGDG